MSGEHALFSIPIEGSEEDVRLAHHALEMLVERASELCEEPESYHVYAACLAGVMNQGLNPHGPYPPIVEAMMPRLIAALRATFTLTIQLPDEGREVDLLISTRAGVLQIGQSSSLSEVEERHRRVLRYARFGEDGWSDWLCGICPRSWPHGSEPIECPDCGQLLIRIQAPTNKGGG